MSKPVLHIDRPVAGLEQLIAGRFEVVGPADLELERADAAIAGAVRWSCARFDLAPRLKVLARTGIGVDSVDLPEATKRSVLVTNTPDGPTVSTAEHAIALLLALTKTLPVHQRRLREATGDYTTKSTAVELDGLTIGLVGFGRIARRVARIASGFGMQVLAYDPYLQDRPNDIRLVDLDLLLSNSDVISLHIPLTAETEAIVDARFLARCRPGCVLINTARGALIDTSALLDALSSGHVWAAGLDVTEPEPLAPEHPLLGLENVIVTPHVASSTVAGRRRMLSLALEQVVQGLAGQRPTDLVNVEVWDR